MQIVHLPRWDLLHLSVVVCLDATVVPASDTPFELFWHQDLRTVSDPKCDSSSSLPTRISDHSLEQ